MSTQLQPAQMTSLGQQANSFVPGMTSPDRGLFLRSSFFRQPKDTARTMQNLHWNGIAWTTELIGYSRLRAAVFNAGAQFMEFGVHNTADGVSHFIQQVGTKVQSWDPTNPASVESLLFTAASQTIPCMRSFAPANFLYVNGADNPQNWDGTSWTAASGWPVTFSGVNYSTPNLVEVFQGRAIYAGFNGQPNAIMFSYFGAPNNFNFTGVGALDPSRAGIYNVPSELGPIVTLESFRVSTSSNEEILLVGCTNGFAFIQGDDANSFQLIKASTKFGFVSNRCWLKLDSTVFALCTDGIRPFPDNINFSSLENAPVTYPIHPVVKNINLPQANQAFVLDNPAELECCWYFPSGSQSHNLSCVILNYAEMNQGLVRFSTKAFPAETTDPNSVHAPSCGTYFKGLALCGGYNGYMQQHYTSNRFNGVGAVALYDSPQIDTPTPKQEGSIRAFTIICEGPSQAFTARATAYPGSAAPGKSPGSSYLRRAQSPTVTNFKSNMSGGTVLGTWVLGSSSLGGPDHQMFDFNPQGAGRGWQVNLSCNTANGDLSLVGIFSILIGGGTRE